MKLLLAGDSLVPEWPGENGWSKLAKQHDVTNVAQAGVSEYKILKQLHNAELKDYDAIVVSRTSPKQSAYPNQPLHKKGLHKDCDLIYTDLEDRNSLSQPKFASGKRLL